MKKERQGEIGIKESITITLISTFIVLLIRYIFKLEDLYFYALIIGIYLKAIIDFIRIFKRDKQEKEAN